MFPTTRVPPLRSLSILDLYMIICATMTWRVVVAILSCLIFGLCTQPRKPPSSLPPRPSEFPCIEHSANDQDQLEQSDEHEQLDAVDQFLRAVVNAKFDSPTDPRLRFELKFALQPASITESLAVRILEGLKRLVDEQIAVELALNAAFLQACELLGKMRVIEDEEMKNTLVALGALALVAPWLMASLGIREIGFMEGDKRCPKIARINMTDERTETWIAKWQEEHSEVISREELYFYLKSLGVSFSLMR